MILRLNLTKDELKWLIVTTRFGWHIIQLVDRDIRPLSQSDYFYQQNIYFDEWFSGIKENIEIKINDVWKDIVPDDPAIQ